jgi:uncharacterized membrane protein (DUF106 family)
MPNQATRIFFYVGILFEALLLGVAAKFVRKDSKQMEKIRKRSKELENLMDSL